MANYALIKGGVVENVIVADEKFVKAIKADWDEIVESTDDSPIGVGYIKQEDGTFAAPETESAPTAAQGE